MNNYLAVDYVLGGIYWWFRYHAIGKWSNTTNTDSRKKKKALNNNRVMREILTNEFLPSGSDSRNLVIVI